MKNYRHRKRGLVLGCIIALCLWLLYGKWDTSRSSSYLIEQLKISRSSSNLRLRSSYHLWNNDGSSDWIKASPIGRFLFVFYDESWNKTVPAALESLSRLQLQYPMLFVAIPNKTSVNSFSSILPEDFLSVYFPAAFIMDVHRGFTKYLLPLKQAGSTPNPNNDDLKARPEHLLASYLLDEFLIPYQLEKLPVFLRNEKSLNNDEPFDIKNPHIVSANSLWFQDITQHSPSFDYIVVFHAPWCGHCRQYEQKLQPVAETIMKYTSGKIRVFKIDATRNDINHPQFKIDKVPHVRYFKAGRSNQSVEMSHIAEDASLPYYHSFLKKHSSLKLPNEIQGYYNDDPNLPDPIEL